MATTHTSTMPFQLLPQRRHPKAPQQPSPLLRLRQRGRVMCRAAARPVRRQRACIAVVQSDGTLTGDGWSMSCACQTHVSMVTEEDRLHSRLRDLCHSRKQEGERGSHRGQVVVAVVVVMVVVHPVSSCSSSAKASPTYEAPHTGAPPTAGGGMRSSALHCVAPAHRRSGACTG